MAVDTTTRTADDYGNPAERPEWMEVDWREHQRWVEVDGTRVNYVEVGEGEPIVFVHGLAGRWANWLENMPHFARTHRAIAVDLPGFGDSPMPPWQISIPAYGRLVDRFCDAIGIEPCTLVGNSMGGFIAAEVAISHPDRVKHLVLVSAAGISQAQMRRRPVEALGRIMVAAGPFFLHMRDHAVRRAGMRQSGFGMVFRYPNRLRPELLWEFSEGTNKPGFLGAMVSLVDYDFRHRLERIAVPTLIVWGRNDHIVPVADADEYERLVRGSRKVIFEQAGHCPMAERPARFNALLEEFLADA